MLNLSMPIRQKPMKKWNLLDRLNIGYQNTKSVHIFLIIVLLIFLAGLGIKFSHNFENTKVLVFFFESKSYYLLSVITLVPLLFATVTIFNPTSESSKYLPIIGSGFGVLIWFSSYYFPQDVRNIFSQFYLIPAMPNGLGDWWAVPDLIRCRDSSGCDRLGRGDGYGHGWKILIFLENNQVALVLGAITAGITCYFIGRLALNFNLPMASLLIYLSPSLLFSLERGQSDLFLVGTVCLLLSMNWLRKSFLFSFSVAALLVSMKVFFVGYLLRGIPRMWKLLIAAPFLFFVFYWSYGFSYARINFARMSTLYPPNLVFGSDQFPAFFKQIRNKFYSDNASGWLGGVEYHSSLKLGVFSLMSMVIFYYWRNQIKVTKFVESIPSPILMDFVNVFSAFYLISYLSGSQVNYKCFLGFPVVFAILNFINNSKSKKNFILYFWAAFCILGVSGLNIWLLRTVGTFCLAATCGLVLLHNFLPKIKFSR